jgi:hypothetical protein
MRFFSLKRFASTLIFDKRAKQTITWTKEAIFSLLCPTIE